MKEEEHTRQELNRISPLLAGISNKMLNEIPGGYFNELSEKIISRLQEIPINISPANVPYELPEKYFDTLPQIIIEKIKAGNAIEEKDELMEIAPILSSISKRNVYSVEADYFEKSATNFFPKKEKDSAKIISLPHWAQYLVAASVFTIISIGAVFYIQNDSAHISGGNTFTVELQSLPDSAISNYLESTPVYSIGINTPVNQQIDINSLLYNISDQQIEQYLDETKDITTVPGSNI